MTHKALRFGFGVCGARPPAVCASQNRQVDCAECLAIIAARQAAAKAEAREAGVTTDDGLEPPGTR